MRSFMLALILTASAIFSGCQTIENLGQSKREALLNSIVDAREAQKQAKAEFQNALELFSSIPNFKSSELEGKYKQLKYELGVAQSKANAVRSTSQSVQNVADAFFDQWSSELKNFTNENVRAVSQQKWDAARKNYLQLAAALNRTHEKSIPVLEDFSDHVLLLKHNLNATSGRTQYSELAGLQSDTKSLIAEFNNTILMCEKFITELGKN